MIYFYGISDTFWETVVVPVYSSSFLTVHLNYLPTVIVPILQDLVPVDSVPVMQSWVSNSGEVFKKLTKKVNVYLDSPVTAVHRIKDMEITVTAKNHPAEKFNYVIFACPADTIIKSLHSPSLLEYILLYWVGYTDDHDKTFNEGIIHSDSSIIPPDYRRDVLDRYANYVELTRSNPQAPLVVENNFIVSSWIPGIAKHEQTMIISYNTTKQIENPVGKVYNLRAHPDLNFINLGIGMLLRLCQGHKNTYYCGCYATPGNGHDLSFLSGLVVANTIGAPYPFSNKDAKEDFTKLATIMGLCTK